MKRVKDKPKVERPTNWKGDLIMKRVKDKPKVEASFFRGGVSFEVTTPFRDPRYGVGTTTSSFNIRAPRRSIVAAMRRLIKSKT